jgi:hypothetical protein
MLSTKIPASKVKVSVVGWLRQREGAPKFSGSKFIKQAGSDSADSSPKAEPREQRGLSLYTIYSRLWKWGVQPVPYRVTYYFIGCFILWGEVTLLLSSPTSY